MTVQELPGQPIPGRLWVDVAGTTYEQIFQPNAGDHAGYNDYENNQPVQPPNTNQYIAPKIKYRTNGTDTRNIAATNGAVRSGNVVTFTTTTAHLFRQGERIVISGVSDPSFNGAFYIQSANNAPTTTTFTVEQTGPNATSGGGTAQTQPLGGALTGSTFYDGTDFASPWRGNYFFADYNAGRINRATLDTNNNITSVDYFATNVTAAVDATVGPDGALYYIGVTNNTIYRVTFNHGSSQQIILNQTNHNLVEGGAGVFSVRLAVMPSSNVTVNIARTAGDTDITISSGSTLTFTASNWNVPQNVFLSSAQDNDTVNDTATLSVSSTGLTTQTVTVGAIDNDSQVLVLNTTSMTINEGGTGTFSVALQNQPVGNVTVSVARSAGDSNITVQSGATLTFTPSNYNVAQTVTIAAAEDADTANDTATITISSSGANPRTVAVTAIDNENTAPVITSTPVTTAVINAPYTYDVNATGSPAPSYSLTTSPPDMTITATTGVIAWTPASTGVFDVTVRAANGVIPNDEQSWTITVNPDMPPTAILTMPSNGSTVSGTQAEFFGDAVDDVGSVRAEFYIDDVLRYTDVNNNGHYHYGGAHNLWDTTTLTNGSHTLRFAVYDSIGQSDFQQVTVTVDNDLTPPPVLVSIGDVRVAEGNSGSKNAVFSVSLSVATNKTVTVHYATANGTTNGATAGSDYVAKSGTLSFAPGVTTGTITVPILGDTSAEADESLTVDLSNAQYATISRSRGLGTIINDDPVPALSVSDINAAEGNSGSKTFSFNVSLSAANLTNTVTVGYTTDAGPTNPAASGVDYTPSSGTLSFAPGVTSKTVTVTVASETSSEADETFLLKLTSPTNAVLAVAQAIGSILNDDATLSIEDVIVAEGDAGVSYATFAVSLSATVPVDVTVNYVTAKGATTATIGPATAGNDYVLTAGTLTIPAMTLAGSIRVPILGDTRDELDERLLLKLSGAANAAIARAQATGTITDDDAPPTLSIGDVVLVEGDTGTKNAVFMVTLSAASGRTVTVRYATADGVTNPATAGADYTAKSGTLSFSAGTTTSTISVPIAADTAVELDETLLVQLSTPVNSSIARGAAVATIVNDDRGPPALSIGDAVVAEGNSGTKNLVFTVLLSTATNKTVKVDYATANGTVNGATAGSDYTSATGTLSFSPGVTTATISIPIIGDSNTESNETFTVTLSHAQRASIARPQGLGTIINDDPLPALSISDVKAAEGNSGSKTFSFKVSLSAANLANTVTVSYATDAGPTNPATSGADYTPSIDTLSFAPGVTSKTVTVTVAGETSSEADETFLVKLTSPSNAVLAVAQAIGTILNDDATLSINDGIVAEGDAGVAYGTFAVSLSATVPVDVTVNYVTANGVATATTGSATAGSDYVFTVGTLTIPAMTLAGSIRVPILGDTRDEPDERLLVKLSGAANAAIARTQGTGTITDDDAPPTLSIGDVLLVEGDTGTKSAIFKVTLSAASGRTVTVHYATADGVTNPATAGIDYTAAIGTLSFTAGVTSKTISVPIRGDAAVEFDETFTIGLSDAVNASIATGQGLGTIVNDDTSALKLFGARRVRSKSPALRALLLAPIIDEAIAWWRSAGVSAKALTSLRQVRVTVVDLPDNELGRASADTVWIDVDAAGWGWFVDRTPGDDREFSEGLGRGRALKHVDLLAVVAHEFGHVLGLDHADDRYDVMADTLPIGVRRLVR